MKYILIFLVIFSDLPADNDKFNFLVDQEIEIIDEDIEIMFDASDIYTYYYLMGIREGLMCSKRIYKQSEK